MLAYFSVYFSLASMLMYSFPLSSFRHLTYSIVGFTAAARLLGRVHGVVVQAMRQVPSASPTSGNVTIMAGSDTS